MSISFISLRNILHKPNDDVFDEEKDTVENSKKKRQIYIDLPPLVLKKMLEGVLYVFTEKSMKYIFIYTSLHPAVSISHPNWDSLFNTGKQLTVFKVQKCN